MTTNSIYKGDDIGAFGGKIIVNLNNPGGYTITRAEFQCGCFYQNIENPVFPLVFKPSREYTAKFGTVNACTLRIYDENGLRTTANGTMIIRAKNEGIHNGNNRICC